MRSTEGLVRVDSETGDEFVFTDSAYWINPALMRELVYFYRDGDAIFLNLIFQSILGFSAIYVFQQPMIIATQDSPPWKISWSLCSKLTPDFGPPKSIFWLLYSWFAGRQGPNSSEQQSENRLWCSKIRGQVLSSRVDFIDLCVPTSRTKPVAVESSIYADFMVCQGSKKTRRLDEGYGEGSAQGSFKKKVAALMNNVPLKVQRFFFKFRLVLTFMYSNCCFDPSTALWCTLFITNSYFYYNGVAGVSRRIDNIWLIPSATLDTWFSGPLAPHLIANISHKCGW